MRATLVLIASMLTVSTASADDFTDFVAGLSATKPATDAYLNECQMMVTPGGAVRQPCTLTLADLVGTQPGVKLVVTRNKRGFHPRSMIEYREALVEARAGKKVVATFQVLEIGSFDRDPDVPRGWVNASHWSRLIKDKDAQARARAGTLPAPPTIVDAVAPVPADLTLSEADQDDREYAAGSARQLFVEDDPRGRLVYELGNADGAIVFGPGPGQRYQGRKGAKALRAWKVALALEGGIAVQGGTAYLMWSVGHLVGTPTAKGATPVTYVTFAVYAGRMTAGGGALVHDPVLTQLSVAQ